MRTKFSTVQLEVGQALACMSVNDCPRGFRVEELNFSISFGKWRRVRTKFWLGFLRMRIVPYSTSTGPPLSAAH